MIDEAWEKAGERTSQDLLRFGLVAATTLSRNSTFIDIGANRGDYTNVASGYCHPRNIHAFEPIPYLAKYLGETFPEVNIHPVAASNRNEITEFNVANLDELSGLSMRNPTELPGATTFTSIKTKVVRVDTYLRNLVNLELVKIDVEGAEINVLYGMKQTLLRFQPILFVEHGVHGPEHYGYGPKDFWNFAEKLNYKILTVDGQEITTRETMIDSFYNWPIWNYLLVPKQRLTKL